MYSIKVNFPLTETDYQTGNGEGMWVRVDKKTADAYNQDAVGPGYYGILDNDSLYYPGLNHGAVIPFEMRGEFRPVADFQFLSSLQTKLTPEGKAALLRKIAENMSQTFQED